jgi:integrase
VVIGVLPNVSHVLPRPEMKLTRTNVARLSLPAGKSESIVFDDEVPGFGIRLRAGGKRTWIAQYRLGAKQRRLTLGTVGTIDEGEARRRAKTALSKVQLGHDPQMEKLDRRTQAATTLSSVAETYLAVAKANLKPRSFIEVERHLRRHWAPLAENALATIERADIAARLAAIGQENGLFAANRARAALSALFSWAIGEGIAGANPVIGTNKATDEISRNRVLSEREMRLAWQCSGAGAYGTIVRLLILTLQRREEVGGMLWSELDLEHSLWTITEDRTKNGLPHDVPLSPAAVAILKQQPRREDRDLVFGAGEGPFQGWSNAKAALDLRMTAALVKDVSDAKAKIKPWRLHDLRRTGATALGDKLSVLPHVVEAILNHISGHKAGVAGIYNRSIYATEKRDALFRWATLVTVGGSS